MFFIAPDKNMFEADYKAQLIKITSLEQELVNAKNDKKSVESEFELFKRKKAEELRVYSKLLKYV